MGPREYEHHVAKHFASLGYTVEVTSYAGDCGVDVIAFNANERLAIQAKLYGHASRKVNRQNVMELYGAAAYRDCTRAVIVTNGLLLPDAAEVARKLRVEVVHLPATSPGPDTPSPARPETSQPQSATRAPSTPQPATFDSIWRDYIEPMRGTTLRRANGDANVILSVDMGGLIRQTSTGRRGRIRIETFRYAIEKILRDGFVTRDDINQNTSDRASSGVILILSQVPFLEQTSHPTGLKLITDY